MSEGYGISAGNAAAVQERPLIEAKDRLKRSTKELDAVLGELLMRLSGLLLPEPPATLDQVNKPMRNASPVVESLFAIDNDIQGLTRGLRTVLNRLEC